MKIEPIGYVMDCEDYTMSIIRATPGEYAPHAVAVYTEAQMRQAMEACAAICDKHAEQDKFTNYFKVSAFDIRNLIKEMLP